MTLRHVSVAVSMKYNINTRIFIVKEIFYAMYYEVEMWPMLHSAVKFR